MPSRAELELRAGAAGVNASTYPNDSRLEQAVIFAEKAKTSTSTATTIAPSAPSVQAISGGANV